MRKFEGKNGLRGKKNVLNLEIFGGEPLVFEVGYHPCKKMQVIRIVFQDQAMYAHTLFRDAKTRLEKRVYFWSY